VPGATIAYDNAGNMTQDNLGNTYSYDAEGHSVSSGGVQTSFDAFGRAMEQNRNGTYTQIVYSPTGQKFAFMNGATLQQYIVPMVAGMQAVYNNSGLQYYRHADWLQAFHELTLDVIGLERDSTDALRPGARRFL